MKMSKASREEIENAIALAQLTESVCSPRSYESPHFPETGDAFDANKEEDLKKFYLEVKRLSCGLMRVAFGYEVLVENCCCPNAKTLEFNERLTKLIDADDKRIEEAQKDGK